MTEAEMTAAVEKAEAAAAEAVAKTEAAEVAKADAEAKLAEATKPAETEIDKSELSPAARARFEKQEADIVALRKESEANAELAKAERDARLDAVYLTKAEGFVSLGVDAAKLGPILKSAATRLTKEEAEALDEILKAADEQIRAGSLFKEQGKGGDAVRESGDVYEKVLGKAEEIRKSDPKLSEAEAFTAALTGDKELQAEYLAYIR